MTAAAASMAEAGEDRAWSCALSSAWVPRGRHSWSAPLPVRLMAHVARREDTDCLVWTGWTTAHGVPVVTDGRGRQLNARRVSWRVHRVDPVPPRIRRCARDPRCIAAYHMRPLERRPRPCTRPARKLTAAAVAAIRRARRAGARLADLAARHGVTPAAVSNAATGSSWRGVPEPPVRSRRAVPTPGPSAG